MHMKKTIFTLLSFFLSFAAFSFSKEFKFTDYTLTAYYSREVQPGDAVFVRLIIDTKDKKLIKSLEESSGETAKLSIFRLNDDKTPAQKATAKSDFYGIERKAGKKMIHSVLLTGAAISTWAKSGDYSAEITYSAFGKSENTISLPFKIIEKEFVSETIPLNAKNTAIRTDTSPERKAQIESLNKILGTKNYDAVFETSRFEPPTQATRRTSFFGDRRVFAYSDGKSSTTLHYGIDYGVPTGTEIRSSGKGKVVMAEDRISTGWSVVVEHLPGLYSLYYHMSKLNVEVGQTVDRGELLGLSGATGLATGPHLHWEVRLNWEAVSPDFFVSDFTFEKESK